MFLWEDMWYKDKPLIQISQFQEGDTWAKEIQGQTIKNYYDTDFKKWTFLNPRDVTRREQLQKLEKELNNANITLDRG